MANGGAHFAHVGKKIGRSDVITSEGGQVGSCHVPFRRVRVSGEEGGRRKLKTCFISVTNL